MGHAFRPIQIRGGVAVVRVLPAVAAAVGFPTDRPLLKLFPERSI